MLEYIRQAAFDPRVSQIKVNIYRGKTVNDYLTYQRRQKR